jgi:hypothetical protein
VHGENHLTNSVSAVSPWFVRFGFGIWRLGFGFANVYAI